jgi:hypothetical protein
MFYSMFYVPTKSFQEKMTFYMIYVKMINFDTKISLFERVFFFFFARSVKNICFHETLCGHVECEDIHVYISSYFF